MSPVEDPHQRQYNLVYRVPQSHLAQTKEAIFAAGGGVYENGTYVQVACEIPCRGQFIPVAAAGAVPHIGAAGQLEVVDEIQVAILCPRREVAQAAVAALKRSHPYDVPAYEVYKLEDF